ncbi:uncharacterized protein LOC121781746 [Salvia splendens]|uniref:uncharacterized protein LOC121781746 n=1 Tax=Salvia splendens TaxID=180675 RepID=UPI001C2780A5|nr:uncharacterized protein LOC121781746 [Salvia splendens]
MWRNTKAISDDHELESQILDRGGVGTLLRNERGLNSRIEKSYRGPKFVQSYRDLNGDDSIVKKVAGEELIFTTEEVEKLVGEALGADFQMIILSDKSYAARFDRISTDLTGGVTIFSYRLAGPVWDDHMKDYNSIVHEVHFGKTDDDFEEDVWCLYC